MKKMENIMLVVMVAYMLVAFGFTIMNIVIVELPMIGPAMLLFAPAVIVTMFVVTTVVGLVVDMKGGV